jgi:hypothetical protein
MRRTASRGRWQAALYRPTASKTVLTPSKWDFCFTPESRHRSGYAADCDVVVRYDGAKPEDKHLAVIVHCVDEEIIEWLERREAKRKKIPRQSGDEPNLMQAFPKVRVERPSLAAVDQKKHLAVLDSFNLHPPADNRNFYRDIGSRNVVRGASELKRIFVFNA